MSKPFATIDPTALDAVSGGRRSSTSRSSDDDQRLLDALTDIKNSLADLGRQQQQRSSSGLDQLLPILMMKMLTRGSGSGPGCGGGNGAGGGCF